MEPVELSCRENCYEAVIDNYIFFHLSLPPENLRVVAEVVVYQINKHGKSLKETSFSAGWFFLNLILDGDKRTAKMFKGTPRFLVEERSNSNSQVNK